MVIMVTVNEANTTNRNIFIIDRWDKPSIPQIFS